MKPTALHVPTTHQVTPGARVAIVLKADQPTGRTVSGVVRDVLTRGNHPRGIKVRLSDGRVGRVQSMLGGGAGAGTGTGAPDTPGPAAETATGGGGFRGWEGDRERDRAGEPAPTREIGLDAYLKPAKQKPRGRKRGGGEGAASGSEGPSGADLADDGEGSLRPQHETGIAKCPVCEVFEGDEAAVAHHVASHFDA